MQEEEIAGKISQFVASNFNGGGVVDPEQRLLGELVDSLGVFMLSNFLEETFHIEVNETDVTPETFESIKRLTKYVVDRRSGK